MRKKRFRWWRGWSSCVASARSCERLAGISTKETKPKDQKRGAKSGAILAKRSALRKRAEISRRPGRGCVESQTGFSRHSGYRIGLIDDGFWPDGSECGAKAWPPASCLIGSPTRVAAANAVLANGTLAHGLDYDDTLEEAIVHTGCCAGMTALAVGEELSASGKAVLEAAIAGTEVMWKVGLVAPGKFHARGFHPTALCSTFGAAAAAGRLYGLEQGQWGDAFGLCGSQSSGIIEYLADGTWTKRLHPGWSAHGGVIATLLAQQGFRGPARVFEGQHGFYRSFGGA